MRISADETESEIKRINRTYPSLNERSLETILKFYFLSLLQGQNEQNEGIICGSMKQVVEKIQ